jgi:DNA replication protein DnaC
MESIQSITKQMFPFEEVGSKECENCGHVYKLYKTSRGILGTLRGCSV